MDRKNEIIRWAIFITGVLLVCVLVYIFLFALEAPALAEEEEEMDKVYVMCNINSYVTIRSTPRKKHNEIQIAHAGDDFYTDWKKKNGYLHIYGSFDEGEGWIKQEYVTIWEPYVYPEGETFIVTVKKVNCRKWMNGPRRGTLKKGAEVLVYLEGEEWCVTNKGYIQTKYLEMKKEEKDDKEAE